MDSTQVFEPAYCNILYSSRPDGDGKSGASRADNAASATAGGFFLSLLEFLPLCSAPRIVKAECLREECVPDRNTPTAGSGGNPDRANIPFPSGDAGLVTDIAV